MKLTRTWLGREFECPTPWGTSDGYKFIGEYAISWNYFHSYFYVRRFNPEAWRDVFQGQKSGVIADYDLRWQEDKALDALEYRIKKHCIDEFWDDVIGGQNMEEYAKDLLDLVPKQHRQHYVDSYGYIDAVGIVNDFPRNVLAYARNYE
jgi:hypothetical protein